MIGISIVAILDVINDGIDGAAISVDLVISGSNSGPSKINGDLKNFPQFVSVTNNNPSLVGSDGLFSIHVHTLELLNVVYPMLTISILSSNSHKYLE